VTTLEYPFIYSLIHFILYDSSIFFLGNYQKNHLFWRPFIHHRNFISTNNLEARSIYKRTWESITTPLWNLFGAILMSCGVRQSHTVLWKGRSSCEKKVTEIDFFFSLYRDQCFQRPSTCVSRFLESESSIYPVFQKKLLFICWKLAVLYWARLNLLECGTLLQDGDGSVEGWIKPQNLFNHSCCSIWCKG
jgi:hypothetical protein